MATRISDLTYNHACCPRVQSNGFALVVRAVGVCSMVAGMLCFLQPLLVSMPSEVQASAWKVGEDMPHRYQLWLAKLGIQLSFTVLTLDMECRYTHGGGNSWSTEGHAQQKAHEPGPLQIPVPG